MPVTSTLSGSSARAYGLKSGSVKKFNLDFLVIAGGGGGGSSREIAANRAGGGGGAGGYRTSVGTSGRNSSAESSLLSFGRLNYTVTVGAGGASRTTGSNSVFF